GKGSGTNRGHTRRPHAEGPCGNGSRKDNICTKVKQCCSGLCNKKAGKKNLDGKGRCRCVRKNGKCSEDRNCCTRKGQQLSCVNGTCGGSSSPLIPTGDPCVPGVDTCADANASCTTYDTGSPGPAGDYCLLPLLGETCTDDLDCTVYSCYAGACVTCFCGGCPDATLCASPTVASGGSVQAAITAASDGDTITIAPGAYVEDLSITGKNLTLLGCPSGGNEVILKNATQGVRTIQVPDESDLTINDIVIQGDNDIPNSIGGGGIATAGGNVCIGLRTRVEQCARFGAEGGGLYFGKNANEDQTLTITDAAIFDGNVTDSYGGGIYAGDGTAAVLSGNVKLVNNKAANGGGITFYYGGQQTVGANVEITDNAADSYGGGIYFYGGNYTSPATHAVFGGNLLIARNTAGSGGAGIASQYGSQLETIVIEGDALITGNVADTYGGGIYSDNVNLTIRDNAKITANAAMGPTNPYGGGGVYFSCSGANNPVLSLEGATEISGNSSTFEGGGVILRCATLNLSGTASIKNNTAINNGGGVWVDNGAGAAITRSDNASITGNSAADGGGVYDESGGVTVTAGLVTSNTPNNCAGNSLTC
ncbi:MAG: hypothetical protein ACKOWF_02585, partial [Chloroflexota bacterium]